MEAGIQYRPRSVILVYEGIFCHIWNKDGFSVETDKILPSLKFEDHL